MCSINPKLSFSGSQSLVLPSRKGARTTIASRPAMHSVNMHMLPVRRCRLFLDLAGHGHKFSQNRIVLATFTFKMILTLCSFAIGPAKRLGYCAVCRLGSHGRTPSRKLSSLFVFFLWETK
ncbi:unnamed protein product, partial [Ixodes persulcatus]